MAANADAKPSPGRWHDQPVAEPLVVPLPVVVRRELIERPDGVVFAEQDQPAQALLANRPQNRSVWALAVGAWYDVRPTRTPAV
jgi:hypothetical protein